jgi:SPP1 family predicted phage head-tail adaptor
MSPLGEEVITWSTVITLWASVEPLRAREYSAQQQETSEVSTRIFTRDPKTTTITPEMRASWEGHTYNIRQVIRPYEKKRDMELLCTEVL